MTLIALLDLTLRPEVLADAPRVLHETLQATRAFPGCLGVEVLRGADDASRIMVVERWESADSDAAYRAWRATPAGAFHLGSLLAGAPRLTTFTSGTRDLNPTTPRPRLLPRKTRVPTGLGRTPH